MFRQPDSLYAGVLLCSAIILAVVGGSLFWLRMPGDERLRNYRLSRRFVGWAYFSLAFTDVLWLLFLREEYELDFTRILVLAVAAVQATMFSGALVTLVNSRFPLARGVRRHLLAVAAGTASLFGCMLFFPQAFPVLFRLTAAAYCVQIALFARTFVREYRVCRRKLDNFFSDGEMRRLRWVAVSFLMTALIGLTAAAWLVSGLGMPYLFAFTGVYMVFYTFFGMKYINYPAEFGRIAPVIADDVPEPLAAGENIRRSTNGSPRKGMSARVFRWSRWPARSGATAVTCRGMSTPSWGLTSNRGYAPCALPNRSGCCWSIPGLRPSRWARWSASTGAVLFSRSSPK